ncbi:caffeine-induced death protein 2 [Absidia repens]|uniref:Caffeine-induced death protein 2 n=1 Tax=Absidia repens TaxID=90262 RepID=A0A1X2ICD4_9FUNG|nr:caffeine-induced death protein 2 [Absidia repens]
MSSEKSLNPSSCSNFSFFKEFMKDLRRVDDNIINGLNSTDTHSENACGDFFNQLATAYKKREDAVTYCLNVMDSEIDRKSDILQNDPDDLDTQSSLFSDETKRRLIANEMIVEGIVRNRTIEVFKSKCHVFDVTPLDPNP